MVTAQPYYDEGGIRLYHGDCREVVPWLDGGAGRWITVTDPPYGQTSCAWDSWVDGWPGYLPGSEMWCFGTMRMFMERSAEFLTWKFGQDLVWEKHNGSSFHADRFRRVHESVVHFYRGEWAELHRNVPRTFDATRRTVRRKQRPTHMGAIEGSTYTSEDGGPRLQRSVIYMRSMHGTASNETQKPEGIIRPLLEYSAGGDPRILDPFAGAGTVLVVAKAMGLRAVGVELREEQCEVAAKRLAQGVLFT